MEEEDDEAEDEDEDKEEEEEDNDEAEGAAAEVLPTFFLDDTCNRLPHTFLFLLNSGSDFFFSALERRAPRLRATEAAATDRCRHLLLVFKACLRVTITASSCR